MTTMTQLIQPANIYQTLGKPIHRSKSQSSLSSLILISDESDEDDCALKIGDQRNNSLTYHRCSSPLAYSGYYRKKSPSAKPIRHVETDSRPKKVVHFADEFGLELSQMKMIDTDELPLIPDEAFKHLHITDERMDVVTYMKPQFENPFYTEDFNDRLSRQKIVLEQAIVIDNRIHGTVRLVSLDLYKRVKIRLTTDNWISFRDYDATYINNSYDGTCDRFSFTIEVDRDRICLGNNIQFCICYESSGGSEYWDNNSQQNYRLNCLS